MSRAFVRVIPGSLAGSTKRIGAQLAHAMPALRRIMSAWLVGIADYSDRDVMSFVTERVSLQIGTPEVETRWSDGDLVVDVELPGVESVVLDLRTTHWRAAPSGELLVAWREIAAELARTTGARVVEVGDPAAVPPRPEVRWRFDAEANESAPFAARCWCGESGATSPPRLDDCHKVGLCVESCWRRVNEDEEASDDGA